MIQDVSFAYPNSEPLYHNLDLGIDLQSRIALVGPNGAGKTTFIHCLTGMSDTSPDSGDAFVGGKVYLSSVGGGMV